MSIKLSEAGAAAKRSSLSRALPFARAQDGTGRRWLPERRSAAGTLERLAGEPAPVRQRPMAPSHDAVAADAARERLTVLVEDYLGYSPANLWR
jgi:hypothetical protein